MQELINEKTVESPPGDMLEEIAHSGIIDSFVRQNQGQWNQQKWMGLCEEIRRNGFGEVDLNKVCLMLESSKSNYFCQK